MNFPDSTVLHPPQAVSVELQAYIEGVAQTVRQPLLVLGRDGSVVFANRAFCEGFQAPLRSITGKPVYALGNGAWDTPDLRHLLEEWLPREQQVRDAALVFSLPGLGKRHLRVNATILRMTAPVPQMTLLVLEDVTESREAERSLRESKERYRSLFAFSPLPTWVADRETFRFLAVNQAAIEHYGYTEEEFLGMTVPDIRVSEAPECDGTAFFSSPSVGEIIRHRKKDGTVIEVEVRRHPLVFDGRDARLVVVNDITERLRFKAELEQKSREILTIWESMTDAFFTVDTEWRFTYVNAQAEALLQRRRDELLRRNVWEEFPAAVHLAFYNAYQRAMTEQVSVVFEEFFPPLDTWFEVHAYPSPMGLSVYFRDITERRRGEEALQKSLALLQAVTEGTTDAVFVKDAAGRYLMINSSGARIMGAPVEEIIGRDDSAFFNTEMIATIRENDRQTRETGEAHTYEETGTSGGVTRSFLATKAPYRDTSGTIIGIIGISRDITEQKRLQAQLEQAERLSAMVAMVAGVAHELNNPLAAISGHAQLLQRHPDTVVQEDARTIQAMTERAARIVRSLHTFSRQIDGERRSALPLRPLIESGLELARYKLRQTGITVELELTEPDPCPVVSSGQIEQLLLSLISNAEYALRDRPGERRIRIATERATLADRGQVGVTLTVSDNGSGMTPEVQGRVFDPFFTTKPQGEGTGLGLSICHGIAEQHGGRLTLSSEVGVGTSVTLWLPLD